MTRTGSPQVWAREPQVFGDDRGTFHEWFRAEDPAGAAPTLHPLQGNCVVSRRGAVRGAHYTATPPGQRKHFTCVHGTVLAAVVDIRVGSPTFGEVEMHELTIGRTLSTVEGFATAFLSLTDGSVLVYLCSMVFDPALERGLDPLDPELGIPWPDDVPLIVSAKDRAAPGLAQARADGVLPRYEGESTGAAR